MFSNKTRTIIVALATTAALLPASSVAFAAVVPRVGVISQPQPVRPTVVVAKTKEVGSAGIPGYDNLKCEQMQSVAEESEREAAAASNAGNTKKAESSTAVAGMMWNQIGSHCLIVD
jgi:hypothetical protein